jgi:hypothetical protein
VPVANIAATSACEAIQARNLALGFVLRRQHLFDRERDLRIFGLLKAVPAEDGVNVLFSAFAQR